MILGWPSTLCDCVSSRTTRTAIHPLTINEGIELQMCLDSSVLHLDCNQIGVSSKVDDWETNRYEGPSGASESRLSRSKVQGTAICRLQGITDTQKVLGWQWIQAEWEFGDLVQVSMILNDVRLPRRPRVPSFRTQPNETHTRIAFESCPTKLLFTCTACNEACDQKC